MRLSGNSTRIEWTMSRVLSNRRGSDFIDDESKQNILTETVVNECIVFQSADGDVSCCRVALESSDRTKDLDTQWKENSAVTME